MRPGWSSSGRSAFLCFTRALLSKHRPDLVVGEAVIVEVKAVERLDKIHMAQMLT
jgi:GxxExxY protein